MPLMESFIKFTMFEKENNNERYRTVNSKRYESWNIICQSEKNIKVKEFKHIKGN